MTHVDLNQVKVGQHWHRLDETLEWQVVSYDQLIDEIAMRGPGMCTGLLYVAATDFEDGKWVQA